MESPINMRGWCLRLLGIGAALGVLLSSVELAAFFRASGFRHSLLGLAWPAALSAGVVFVVYAFVALACALLWQLFRIDWRRAPLVAIALFGACLFLGLGLSLRHGETWNSFIAQRGAILSSLAVAIPCALAAGYVSAQKDERFSPLCRIAIVLPAVFLAALLALHGFKTGSNLRGGLLVFGSLIPLAWALLTDKRARVSYVGVVHLGMLGSFIVGAWLLRPDSMPKAGVPGEWRGAAVRQIILISVDTLRPAALSCYGSDNSTPGIDQLSKDGIRFERAISPAPWTLPALSSLMTGVTPGVHGAVGRNGFLPRALPTMAEMMAEQGYVTGAIGSNHLLTRGFGRGFHSSNFFPKRALWESVGYRLFDDSEPDTTESLTDLSIDWLEAHKHEPFFLWLHYFDPHSPYAPPREYQPEGTPPARIGRSVGGALFTALRTDLTPTPKEREWVKALYAGEVRYVDANIARLLAKLKELELYDDALILLTSDHGEEFWEHESLGHGHNLFDESLRVPLIVKAPGSGARAKVQNTVSTRRILPTILELCGIDTGPNEHLANSLVSTWKALAESSPPESNLVISSGMLYGEDKVAITGASGKYILGRESRREWFFELTKDPAELYPISPVGFSGADVLRAALGRFEDAARAIGAMLGAEAEHVDQVDTDALKALGYL